MPRIRWRTPRQALRELGYPMLDALVSGSMTGTEVGTLSIMYTAGLREQGEENVSAVFVGGTETGVGGEERM